MGRVAHVVMVPPVPAAGTGRIPRTAALAGLRRVVVGIAVRRRALPGVPGAVLAGQ